VGLASSRRAQEEDPPVLDRDEVEEAEMSVGVPLEGPLVIEVEVLELLACRDPGDADSHLVALDWRSATSRSRKAANSSWHQS